MRRSFGLIMGLAVVAGLGVVPALSAQAAAGAVSGIQASIVFDGTAPFDADSAPGHDDGAKNGVVRTQDQVKYNLIVSYERTGDVVLTSVLPSGMEWDATATAATVCNGPGGGKISADKRTWTCNRTADGLSESFDVGAWVNAVGNGTSIAPEFSSDSVTGKAPAVTVSATPKTEFRILTESNHFYFNQTYNGALGMKYDITNYLGATSASGDFRGYEALADTFSYTMSVPEGAVITSQSTALGGTITSTQDAPGADVTLTLTGAKTGYLNVQRDVAGVPADFEVLGTVKVYLWVPYDPTLPEGQKTAITTQFKGFDPLSLSGVSNFGDGYTPGQEPGYTCPEGTLMGGQLACMRNTIDRESAVVVRGTNGGAMQAPGIALLGDGHGYAQNEEKIVPGQSFFALTGLYNEPSAISAATAPRGCAAWDNTNLALNGTPKVVYADGSSSTAFYAGGGKAVPDGTATVEYSAKTFASDAERKDYDCGIAGDGASGWVSAPSELVGGIDSVTAVRMSSSLTLDPARAIGIQLPLRRTTTAASLALPVNQQLPWFWQYGTAETGLVKSAFTGSGSTSVGASVQAVPSLVRATTTWSDASVDPGTISSVTVHPAVIGPVGVGVDSVAKNVAVQVTMNSVCAEPVEASLQALVANGAIESYDYTPGVIGGDGISCAQGGTPAVITMHLGDVVAPGGAAGGSFHSTVAGHQTDLQPLSMQVTNSVLTPSGSTHVATTLISADTDTSRGDWRNIVNLMGSAVQTDRTTTASLVVTGVASFKGGKTAATAIQGMVAPGEAFAYTINWANGTSKEVGPGTFVDLLPYNGDARGSAGLGAAGLQVVDVRASTPNPVMGDVVVEYTTQAPGTVATAIDQAGNEDGHTGITWQTGVVPPTATALRFVTQNPINPGYSGSATITVKAPTLAIGGVLKNNMYGRTLPVGGDETSVMAFRAAAGVELTSSAGEITGTIYRDLNFNGVYDAGVDVTWPGAVNLQATSVANSYTGAVSSGNFGISPIAPGAYSLNLVNVPEWTRISPLGTLDVEAGQRLTGQNVLYQENVADPVLVADPAGVSQGEAVTVDVTGNDTLAFPVTAGSVFDVDTVALGGQAPTYGTVEVVAPTGAATQSSIKYTASATWPAAYADATKYTDTFTYSWTNAVGVTESATVTVTVYQPVIAVDDTARIADLPAHVDVLTNDSGDGRIITGTPTLTSGDATVALDANTPDDLVLTPAHVWADGEAEHNVVVAYQVVDSRGQTATANVTVTIQRKPVVTGEVTRKIAEGTSTTFDYTVLNPDVLETAAVSAAPDAGSATIDQASGAVTFNGAGAAGGDHNFSVTFTDNLGQSTVVGYTVTVQAAPTAAGPPAVKIPESGSTSSNTVVTTTGTITSATTSDVPAGATVTATADGAVSFVAGPDLAPGTYTFSVTYTDDLGQTVVVPHTVTVQPAPIAHDPASVIIPEGGKTEFLTLIENPEYLQSAVIVRNGGLLRGDGTDSEITAAPDGQVTFAADKSPGGPQVFDVIYTDDLGQSTSATYTVMVQAAPLATGPTNALVGIGQATAFDTVLTTTGTIADAQVTAAPTAGVVTVTTGGAITFDPKDAPAGKYTFDVTYTDNLGQTVTVTYTVVVQAAPLVTGITDRIIGEGQEVSIPLAVTTEGTIASAEVLTAPTSGSATVGIDGTVGYAAGTAVPGIYPFTVRFTDNLGQTTTVDIIITVRARPVVEGSTTKVPVGGTASLTENVTTEGFIASREVVEQPTAGTVTLGSVIFAAGDAAPGEYTFVVRYTDDLGQTADARYTVTVQAPPTGVGETINLSSDTETAVVDPVGSSTGVNLQGVQAADLVQPAHGSVSVTKGTVTYLPERGFVGSTTFSVVVRDDLGQSVVLIYTVTVQAPPPAVSDGGTTAAKGGLAITGTDITRIGVSALAAFLAGWFLLALVRRRREQQD